jgi:hypothetical protein
VHECAGERNGASERYMSGYATNQELNRFANRDFRLVADQKEPMSTESQIASAMPTGPMSQQVRRVLLNAFTGNLPSLSGNACRFNRSLQHHLIN